MPRSSAIATARAADWLQNYLRGQERVDVLTIRCAAHRAGHPVDALRRARRLLGVASESTGVPRLTYWSLPTTSTTITTVDAGDAGHGRIDLPHQHELQHAGQRHGGHADLQDDRQRKEMNRR